MLRASFSSRAALVACALASLVSGDARAEWKLDDHLPDALSIHVDHRTRYEFLDDQFRILQNKDTDVVVFRTRVHGRLRLPWGLTAGAELQDSRAEKNDDTLLSTTIVNAAELLQAYLEFEGGGPGGGSLRARGGRMTMDVGSRRFVARNRFRNTSNGFTGLDVEWNAEQRPGRPTLRGFWTLPVFREPIRQDRLRDNDVVFDTESVDVQFWGLFAARDLERLGRLELFVFGVHERDASDRPTRDRQLATPGLRLFRSPERGRMDHELEVAVQVGESRANILSTEDLDHLAHFEHLTLGYTFDYAGSPRVALQFDYASGDENPTDGSNERFDTLYGARRFDFGPTGIYGPFARSNLITPGLRIGATPVKGLSTFVAPRAVWRAAPNDAWTTTRLPPPTRDSGRYVGSQVELRVRWQVIPGNLTLEGGYAHLFAGDFIDDAPNSNRQGDSNYVYTQAMIEF